jgi:hypothetical protein
MIPTILFDRSIFHREKFQQLESSGLVKLVKHRRMRVFLTPMFVEETLRHALNNEQEFADHLGFLDSLLGQKWFKFSREIIAIELGDRIGGQEYYLQPKDLVRTTYRNSRGSFWKQLPPDEFRAARDRIARNRLQDSFFRQSRLDLRGKPQVPLDYFSQYVDQHADWVIENIFMKVEPNSSNFLTTWRNKRSICKFSEQLLRSSLATIFLAAADHNLRLDVNDLSDADQLAFMIWADIMVSDDFRFLKKAFGLLYSDTTKRLMTSIQFLDYLDAATAANNRQTGARRLDRR